MACLKSSTKLTAWNNADLLDNYTIREWLQLSKINWKCLFNTKCISKCRLQNGSHFSGLMLFFLFSFLQTAVTFISGGAPGMGSTNTGGKLWWRHPMETFSELLAICAMEFTGHRWIPRTKASDAELWCFLICAWINGWVNNREAGDLRRHRTHYDCHCKCE